MSSVDVLLARRYAQAFLNITHPHLSPTDLRMLVSMAKMLADYKQYIFLLELPFIAHETKTAWVRQLCVDFNISFPLAILVQRLVDDKRVALLPEVIRLFGVLYKKEKKLIACTITSAHELGDQERLIIKQFIERQTGCSLMETYTVNKNLIAGLRIESDEILWEYSIDKQLRALSLSLTH